MNEELLRDALDGLKSTPKTLPCKWFYDAQGSRLFEQICELPEYYPTRTELSILQSYSHEIAEHLGPNITLIELGSGSSFKTRVLLRECDVFTYVPLDISASILGESAGKLSAEFPHIEIKPLEIDYTKSWELNNISHRNRVVFFPGSTIGNFTSSEAQEFLQNVANVSGKILLGVDLKKPVDVLLGAYNDAPGVTARFNLNLLVRLNQEVGADFVLEKWRHQAVWDEEESRIEMRLISTEQQCVTVGGESIQFERGEWIITEYSHKYSSHLIQEFLQSAGWCLEKSWTDEKKWFAVQLLRAC
jgi:L-histidine N-alpha-methyltransferase